MKILDNDSAKLIREEYIRKFVNTDSPYYMNYVKRRIKFKDGLCYTGYLWDCLRSKMIVSEKACLNVLKDFENFMLFWDIHSSERILIENYWKYPKSAIIKLNFDEFNEFYNTFPEDIYIFDESFSWTVTLTHEYNLKGKRYCLMVFK